MIRTQISLEATMYRRAQAAARREGVSLAEYVRRALSKVLGGKPAGGEKQWMKWSGSVRGGRPADADADRIDEVVYGREPNDL